MCRGHGVGLACLLKVPHVHRHATEWHESWGEEWTTDKKVMKYTDRWAERVDDFGKREWGDKWEEKWGHDGMPGRKIGETWSREADGGSWSQTWGEEYASDNRVHRFGQSTSGNHWDHWEDGEGWYERAPHFGFDLALVHSPELLNVQLRKRNGKGLVPRKPSQVVSRAKHYQYRKKSL